MLHLKQTLHKYYMTTSSTISTIVTELLSLGVVRLSYPLVENLGRTLLSLTLLLIIPLLLSSDIYLKFVVADRSDIDEAGRAVQAYRDVGVECPVYCMPLGGRSEEYVLNVKEVAEVCMEKGWRFTPRLHISLFGNAWGT